MARTITVLLLAACVGAGACGARRQAAPSRRLSAIAAAVDALVREGCYQCLRAALEALPAPGSPLDARRFVVLTLLGARARQLDFIRDPDWLAAARDLVPQPSPEQQLILELAGATPTPGGTRDLPLTWQRREALAAGAAALAAAAAGEDPVAQYFLEQGRCLGLRGLTEDTAIGGPAAVPPLVTFVRATCGRADSGAIETLASANPRYQEVHYFKAIGAFARGELLTTERELDAFDAAFPRSPASSMLRGQVLGALEEFDAAVAAFDEVLAVEPDRPDALLHRMRALSHAGDAPRGAAAANRLIAVGTWHQGEAYYWRAWNRRALGALDAAADDIETAKRVLFNAAVPKLAGFIAFERNLMPDALAELTTARERNTGDCEVTFALGQVHARDRRWAEAAAAFAETIVCTQAAQTLAASKLDEIARADLAPARRERMRARAERARAAEYAREGMATFNAGTASALAGRPVEARPLLQRAAAWAQWASRAQELLATLPPPDQPD